jgi:hypothetical protein
LWIRICTLFVHHRLYQKIIISMKPYQLRHHKFTVTLILLTLRVSLVGLIGSEAASEGWAPFLFKVIYSFISFTYSKAF